MRRKQGTLIPLEQSIIEAAVDLNRKGTSEFYGFQIAKKIRDREGARNLTSFGTLYHALERLHKQGFLIRQWEDPTIAAEQNRPRRRLYQLTGKAATVTSFIPVHGVPLVLVLGESPL